MTYKYLEVRREIFDKCPDKPLKKTRSLGDMKSLFKWSYWAILILIVVALFILGGLLLFYPEKPYYFIPGFMIFVIAIIAEFGHEKLYNLDERNKEKADMKEAYANYIGNAESVLQSCGITHKSQKERLKAECMERLEAQARPYKDVTSRVFDNLIGVPVGALITAVIYENTGESEMSPIMFLIVIGGITIGALWGLKTLSYYSDGYFKDRYLLKVLNELEYYQK